MVVVAEGCGDTLLQSSGEVDGDLADLGVDFEVVDFQSSNCQHLQNTFETSLKPLTCVV